MTEVTEAQAEKCIPMLDMHLQLGNRASHAIADNSSWQETGQSRRSGETAVARDGPKAGTIVAGKPAPPLPPPERTSQEAGERKEQEKGSCPKAATSGTSKPPPPLPPSHQLQEQVPENSKNTDQGTPKLDLRLRPQMCRPQWKSKQINRKQDRKSRYSLRRIQR